MSNTNVLAGIACPSCKSEGPFLIWTNALSVVADVGVIDVKDFEWTDDDECTCETCQHKGQVKDFRIAEPTNG